MNFSVLFLAATLLVAVSATQIESPAVPVTVYYESLCPDSIKFITKQLYPAWEKFGNALDINLIPFGKANYIRTENGTLSFDCHHGPNECLGNKVQACALKKLVNTDDRIKYVNCVMDKVKPKDEPFSYPGEKCAQKLSLVYDSIKTCANSTEGDELLAAFGNETQAFQAKLTNVPTVVINMKYSKDGNKRAVDNLESELCSNWGGSKGNKLCKNSAASNSATLLLSVLAVVVAKMF